MKVITIQDLLPTGEGMMNDAYSSTSGDPVVESVGIHKGQNPNRRDTMGLTKTIIHDRAAAGDFWWFNQLADQFRNAPFRLPPSLRTWIPKDEDNPDKGERPVDDPAELKRLVTLFVRWRIGRQAEMMMTKGQYGGRPARFITPVCERKGATAQDQVAAAIHQAIWQGYPHCLMLDLTNAFGLVPRRAAIREFKRMGCDDEAAQWIWRLVHIDAVDARNRRTRYPRRGRGIKPGIEQGNPLSSMTMNQVLAPIFRRMEARLNVRVFSYLDDIYVMTPTEDEAYEAFKWFRQSARSRGFTNVRRLWSPGDPADSKNSRIIDTRQEPVPVLKTYLVDSIGISLHPKKVSKFIAEKLIRGKLTIGELRQVTQCQALTKRASRERTPEIIRLAPWDRSHLSAVAGEVGCGSTDDPIGYHHLCVPAPASEKQEHGLQVDNEVGAYPVEPEPTSSQPPYPREIGRTEDVGCPMSAYLTGMGSSDGTLYPCCCPMDGKRMDEDGLHCSSSSYLPYCVGMHSQFDQAGDIPRNGDSPETEGGETRDRRGDVAAERHPCLSVLSEVGKRLVAERRRPGNDYKGSVLDLRGLSSLIAGRLDLVQTVNRLIKIVRIERRATLLIDPVEEWTADPGLLGNSEDPVYEQTSYELQPDGTARLELYHRRQKPVRTSPPEPPAGVDLVISRVRCVNFGLFEYEVTFTHKGRRGREVVSVGTPNGAAGAFRAIGTIIGRHPANSVAIWLRGLAGVMELLTNEEAKPTQVVFRQDFKELLDWMEWNEDGAWLMGSHSRNRT